VGNRLMAIMEARYRKLTALERMRVQRFTPLAASLYPAGATAIDNDDTQLTLLGMLLDQAYQEALRTPPAAPQGKEESRQHSRPQREARDRNQRNQRPQRRERDRDEQAAKPARAPRPAQEASVTPAAQADLAAEEAQRKSRRRKRNNRKPRPEGDAPQAETMQAKQED
jgi:ATP-dependent RNA helicase DeaD